MKFRQKCIAKVCSLAIATATVSTMFFSIPVRGEENHLNYTIDYLESKGYVKLSSYKSRLNIREKPTTKSKVLGELSAGDIVNIVEEKEDFYKIKLDNDFKVSYGYVYKDYVVIQSKDTEEYELIAAAVITSAKSSENRNYNMSLACEKINGLVLEPEDKFDWYGKNGVGQASKANGFKQSTIISGGKYVKGYGGGVCQVSTALYNAIYDLGIEPEEHHHHSLQSSYVEKGMDATVAYPSKNFTFYNTKDYTIEIEAFTDGGQVTILLYKVE